MVANGHLETPTTTVELQFEVGDILFKQRFIVVTNLTSRLSGLLFLQRNSTILDMRHGVLHFLFFSMQLKHADKTYSNSDELLLNPTDTLNQLIKQTGVYMSLEVYTENETTGILQAYPDLEENDDIIICPASATIQNKQFAVLIKNFLERPYTLKERHATIRFSLY